MGNLKQFCPFVVVIQIFIIDLVENFHDLTSKFQIGKRQINDDQKIAYWHALMFHITFHRNGGLCLLPAMLVLHEWDEIDVGVVKRSMQEQCKATFVYELLTVRNR